MLGNIIKLKGNEVINNGHEAFNKAGFTREEAAGVGFNLDL